MSEPVLRVSACRVHLNPQIDDHLKGFASIILNEVFAVCDLKIIQGHNKLFVAMPSRRRRDGTFHDVAHPICQDLRNHIERVVLETYDKQIQAGETDADADADSEPNISESSHC